VKYKFLVEYFSDYENSSYYLDHESYSYKKSNFLELSSLLNIKTNKEEDLVHNNDMVLLIFILLNNDNDDLYIKEYYKYFMK